VKAVFLDYDTVSTGDLDISGLRATVGELTLYDSDDSQIAARIRDRARTPAQGDAAIGVLGPCRVENGARQRGVARRSLGGAH